MTKTKLTTKLPNTTDLRFITPKHPLFADLLASMVNEPGERAGCMACGKEIDGKVREIVVIQRWIASEPMMHGGLCRVCASLPKEAKTDRLMNGAALTGLRLPSGRA